MVRDLKPQQKGPRERNKNTTFVAEEGPHSGILAVRLRGQRVVLRCENVFCVVVVFVCVFVRRLVPALLVWCGVWYFTLEMMSRWTQSDHPWPTFFKPVVPRSDIPLVLSRVASGWILDRFHTGASFGRALSVLLLVRLRGHGARRLSLLLCCRSRYWNCTPRFVRGASPGERELVA